MQLVGKQCIFWTELSSLLIWRFDQSQSREQMRCGRINKPILASAPVCFTWENETRICSSNELWGRNNPPESSSDDTNKSRWPPLVPIATACTLFFPSSFAQRCTSLYMTLLLGCVISMPFSHKRMPSVFLYHGSDNRSVWVLTLCEPMPTLSDSSAVLRFPFPSPVQGPE